MRNLLSFASLFLGFFLSHPVLASLSCAGWYSESKISQSEIPTQKLDVILRELVDLYFEIHDMADPGQKNIELAEYKRKLKKVAESSSQNVRETVSAMIEDRMNRHSKSKIEEQRKLETHDEKTKAAETEALMKWRRQRPLEDVATLGPFLNDTQMFFFNKRGELSVFDFKERKVVYKKDISDGDKDFRPPHTSRMILSPDKRHLVITYLKGIDVLDRNDGTIHRVPFTNSTGFGFHRAKFSRNGSFLFLAGLRGEMFILGFPSLNILKYKKADANPGGTGISESTDGRFVFFSYPNQLHMLFDLHTQREIEIRDLKNRGLAEVQDAVFSLDSKSLILFGPDHSGLEYNLVTNMLSDSPVKKISSDHGKVFVSEDERFVIMTMSVQDQTTKMPFMLFDRATWKNIPIDFTHLTLNRPMDFSLLGNSLIFRDSIKGSGSDPDLKFIVLFDLKTKMVEQIPVEFARPIFKYRAKSPDGNFFIGDSNSEFYEVY